MKEPKPPEGLAEWMQDTEQEQDHALSWVERAIAASKEMLSRGPTACERTTPVIENETKLRSPMKTKSRKRKTPTVSNEGKPVEKMRAATVVRATPGIER